MCCASELFLLREVKCLLCSFWLEMCINLTLVLIQTENCREKRRSLMLFVIVFALSPDVRYPPQKNAFKATSLLVSNNQYVCYYISALL